MGFFGAMFADLTLYWQWQVRGVELVLPVLGFLAIAIAAAYVIRLAGKGLVPSKRVERAITWSSVGEGVGLFVAANLVINLHRPDLLLPAMALVVGLHFLPIAFVARFGPYYLVGTALIVAGIAGVAITAPAGGAIAGFGAAAGLWLAAILAVRRDWRFKRAEALFN